MRESARVCEVEIDLIFDENGVDMLIVVIVVPTDPHLQCLVLPRVGPYPFGIDLVLGQSSRRCAELLLLDSFRCSCGLRLSAAPPVKGEVNLLL